MKEKKEVKMTIRITPTSRKKLEEIAVRENISKEAVIEKSIKFYDVFAIKKEEIIEKWLMNDAL